MNWNIVVQTTLLIIFFQSIFLLVTFFTHKNNLLSATYGLLFVIFGISLTSYSSASILFLINSLVIAWGIRLTLVRLSKLTKSTPPNTSIMYLALFQLASSFIILYPVIYSISSDKSEYSIPLAFVGLLVWFSGFALEILADYKIISFMFLSEDESEASSFPLLRAHPNYLGEILMWWGIYILCIQLVVSLRFALIFSPIYVTIIVIITNIIPTVRKRKNSAKVSDLKPIPKKIVK